MSPISSLLIFASVVALPSLGSVISSVEHCTNNSDCQSSSCCLLGPNRYSIPTCMSLQQKGEQCRENASTITTALYYPDNSHIDVNKVNYILCPCADGLSCERGVCN